MGAYGLRVVGVGSCQGLLAPVPDRLPTVTMAFEQGRAEEASVGDDRIVFAMGNGRSIAIERATGVATCRAPRRPSPGEIAHPLLTAAAAAAGLWGRYELIHAAAFVAAGGVWALMGDKGSGKSTLAATLAGQGYPIFCDDMLALRRQTAFPGPRCVDLRGEAARRLGMGELLPGEGPRERWRVRLPGVDPELPVRGWIFLRWAEKVEMRPLAMPETIRRLAAARTWRGHEADPVRLLDLAALPAWELGRPASWTSFPAVISAIETGIASRHGSRAYAT